MKFFIGFCCGSFVQVMVWIIIPHINRKNFFIKMLEIFLLIVFYMFCCCVTALFIKD